MLEAELCHKGFGYVAVVFLQDGHIGQWSIQKLGIITDGIANKEYRKTELSKESPRFIRQRYVPFPVPGNIDIFRDRVLITVWREKPVGILIHSQEVADNFRAYFNSEHISILYGR